MMKMTQVTMAALAVVMAQGAFAAVSADEAKQLGSTLTLTGAEKAGNKDGTIPAYSGKAPKIPASYNKATPNIRTDPYGEKPLFTITAANAAQYADKLDGMVEVFKKYPNYRMDVYPSHRDYAYPKYVLDNTLKNATSCKAVNDESKLEGCYGGTPFPVPKTAKQVMWNHLLQYNFFSTFVASNSWVTPPNGQAILQVSNEFQQQFDYYDPANDKPRSSDSSYWKLVMTDLAPARKVGGKLLLVDALDTSRRAYQYIPGQRRVKLSPNLAFDTPSPITGGSSNMDDARGFSGSMERFDFKLVGKKEKFIMYNNYNIYDPKACPEEKLVNNANFPHPDCVRWELHRVWKVEATLKPEFRHVYAKRVFFWDEDAPGAGMAENYDASGKIYRIISQAQVSFYEDPVAAGGETGTSFNMDLTSGTWSIQGSTQTGWQIKPRFEERIFSPESLSGSAIR